MTLLIWAFSNTRTNKSSSKKLLKCGGLSDPWSTGLLQCSGNRNMRGILRVRWCICVFISFTCVNTFQMSHRAYGTSAQEHTAGRLAAGKQPCRQTDSQAGVLRVCLWGQSQSDSESRSDGWQEQAAGRLMSLSVLSQSWLVILKNVSRVQLGERAPTMKNIYILWKQGAIFLGEKCACDCVHISFVHTHTHTQRCQKVTH